MTYSAYSRMANAASHYTGSRFAARLQPSELISSELIRSAPASQHNEDTAVRCGLSDMTGRNTGSGKSPTHLGQRVGEENRLRHGGKARSSRRPSSLRRGKRKRGIGSPRLHFDCYIDLSELFPTVGRQSCIAVATECIGDPANHPAGW